MLSGFYVGRYDEGMVIEAGQNSNGNIPKIVLCLIKTMELS